MKQHRYLLSFISAGVLLFSCTDKHESFPESPGDTCVYYTELVWGNYESRSYNFIFPCFHPANADEFVYVRHKNSYPNSYEYELRKHILSSGQDMFLTLGTSNIMYISMDRNGWVYFNDHDYRIWKIKDDGSGLAQVTDHAGLFHSVVNPAGQYIIVNKNSGGTFVLDQEDGYLDTLDRKYNPACWMNDTLILILNREDPDPDPSSPTDWKLMSYPQKQIYATGSFPFYTFFLAPVNETEMLYIMNDILNYHTGTEKSSPVIAECGDRYSYSSFSYSKSAHKILIGLNKTVLMDTATNTYFNTHDIMMINPDGSDLEIISLPQTP